MPVLTTQTTEELILPMGQPTRMYRTVERKAENHWEVAGWSTHFSTGLDALMALREEVERRSSHPVKLHIEWRGLVAGSPPPSTGVSL